MHIFYEEEATNRFDSTEVFVLPSYPILIAPFIAVR